MTINLGANLCRIKSILHRKLSVTGALPKIHSQCSSSANGCAITHDAEGDNWLMGNFLANLFGGFVYWMRDQELIKKLQKSRLQIMTTARFQLIYFRIDDLASRFHWNWHFYNNLAETHFFLVGNNVRSNGALIKIIIHPRVCRSFGWTREIPTSHGAHYWCSLEMFATISFELGGTYFVPS